MTARAAGSRSSPPRCAGSAGCIPPAPARILDAGCGPGLYAVPLARLGYDVTGVDVSAPALRHARGLARETRLLGKARFVKGDLRDVPLPEAGFDAALLVYFVLEAFSRTEQPKVLARLAGSLAPNGTLIVEMRLHPDQPPGRIDWWDVVPNSLLSDRRHLLLGDAVYDQRRHTYVLREVAVFDDGSVAARQTSGWLCPFASIPRLFAQAGLPSVRCSTGGAAPGARALRLDPRRGPAPPALSRLDGRCEPLPFVPSVRESCLELIHHADTHT